MKTTSLLAMIGICVVSETSASERLPVMAGNDNFPIVAIWYSGSRDINPHVIAAIWEDGSAVWSTNALHGEPPYFESHVDPDTLNSTLNMLASNGVFSAPFIRKNNFGPDSSFTAIFIQSGTNTLISRSWHESAEKNTNIVAASYGLTHLNGKSRDIFIESDDPDYINYRKLWQSIRQQINKLLNEETATPINTSFTLKKKNFQHAPPEGRGEAPRP